MSSAGLEDSTRPTKARIMAEPKKFQFDVWLTHANTVYRGVPYEVVTDWIQQGRLLEDDRIRPVATEEWFVLAKVPAFSGYLPKHEPLRTDQQAEALEPVESGFAWGQKGEDEDVDPDMIPLIDVSLVLLIFFMMTSYREWSGSGSTPLVQTNLSNTAFESISRNSRSPTPA